VSTIFLTDSHGTLVGSVPLARIVLARPEEPMLSLVSEPLISCHADAKEKEFTELIDKYNLPALAVVDDQKKLVGVVTSDDVIALLRAKL
jgi:magnesium transporter